MNHPDLPLVSISIPAYNHERYVQETIRSVIEQDYPRIELIVIDDGSKDSTWAKIEALRGECEKRFERVVMYTRPNKGRVATALEIGTLLRGDFCGGIASDDRFLPGAISALLKPMLEDESIGNVVGVNILIDADSKRCYWDEKRNCVYDERSAKWKTFDEFITSYSKVDMAGDEFGRYETFVRCNHVGNGQLRRRSLTKQLEYPYHERAPLEDEWFHLQFSKIAKYKHIDIPTFAYRWHGANTASQGAYMSKIWNETMSFELERVRENGEERFKEAWRKRGSITRDVFGLRLGSHRPHINRVMSVDWTQYTFNICGHALPLTPKMKVKHATRELMHEA